MKNYKNILKVFEVHTDTKNKNGRDMDVVYIKAINNNEFDLVSTDGSSMLIGNFDVNDWIQLRSIIPLLPENITTGYIREGVFCSEEKWEGFIFPDYNKIVFNETEQANNPVDQYPVFSFDVYARAQKTFKLLDYDVKEKYFFFKPDFWKSKISPAIKKFDKYTLVLMPVRI